MEELWHGAHLLICIDIIAPILELVPVVLHTSVQQLRPLISVQGTDKLLALTLSDEVIEDVKTWDGSSHGKAGIWKVYDGTFLEIIFVFCRVEKC